MSSAQAPAGKPQAPQDTLLESSSVQREVPATDTPLVSIVILNYKRREELAMTLGSVVRQDYPNREIIVVDNHSEEDIRSVVAEQGSDIQLMELERNMGSCAGRNAGIRQAHGEFIVTLDNDVPLASPFELSKMVKAFQERPDIHVLVFQICDADTGKLRLREWCHPKFWKEFGQTEFETYFLPEGASAFRRTAFETVGFYYEPLFICHEGGDLAFRMIEHGLRMLYCPRVRVFHLMSPEGRIGGKSIYFHTRNWIWLAYKDFHFYRGLKFVLPRMAMMFLFALRTRCLGYYVAGIRDGVVGLKQIRNDRTPMTRKTIKYLSVLDRGRPNLWVRWARHREQPQI